MKKLITLFAFLATFAQAQTTLKGGVLDAKTGEMLIQAYIKIENTTLGTATDINGRFELEIPKQTEKITLIASYLGYTDEIKTLIAPFPSDIIFKMSPSEKLLDEVTISATTYKDQVRSTQMSVERLKTDDAKLLPVLFGESDLLKTLQLKPGVVGGGEGSSGIFVRGGASDQNLFLLDNAQLYNPSHLFGFFSTFNSDAIEGISLYKGGFPAQYGGRLSSVIDTDTKDGDKNALHGTGGVGLISSRLTITAPIQKNKSSFIVSARRTYFDVFTRAFNKTIENDPELSKSQLPAYYFQDFNAKFNFDISKKDQITVFGYWGNDNFEVARPTFKFNFAWGNNTVGVLWKRSINDKLALNTQIHRVGYVYELGFANPFLNVKGAIGADLEDYVAQTTLNYIPDTSTVIKFGGGYIYHNFGQGTVDFSIDNAVGSTKININQRLFANEINAFANINKVFDTHWSANAGFRASAWTSRDKWYFNPEPRLGVTCAFNDKISLKANYARMAQYTHLVSNSASTLPSDIWYPSNNRIPPQTSDQVAAGVTWNLGESFLFTNEYYYKWLNNQSDYKQGATLFGNNQLDTAFVFGKGWTYGSEFYLEKKQKKGSNIWYDKLSGWVSYTLSWSYRQFDEINDGKAFFPKNDRRHDISVVAIYPINKRLNASATWVYNTGQAFTLSNGLAIFIDPIRGQFANIPLFSERNGARQPDYHRLDLGLVWKFRPRKGSRSKLESSDLTFSIYNAYNRLNAYFIYQDIKTEDDTNRILGITSKQVSLFPVIPSVTYNFKF
jgi:CarboxypepD_reg-like domain/TonB-dependent Receptor Plug Domain